MIKLVVALGNPGKQYELTRHNVAWMLLEQSTKFSTLIWREKYKGLYADFEFLGNKVFFLRPQTFMNLSGESVCPFAQYYKINIDEILVLHDELDLRFGEIMFKKGGGLAGHNGLKSIATCLGGTNFWRMRLGISRPAFGSVANWVLSPFSSDEKISLINFLKEGVSAFELALTEGFKKASIKYNKKNFAN